MAEMTAERENAILARAIDEYGEDAQTDMIIGELSELTRALLKLRWASISLETPGGTGFDRLKELRDNVIEELADVQIMLNQMQLLYGDCTEWEIKKLERLAWRLGMEDGAEEESPILYGNGKPYHIWDDGT